MRALGKKPLQAKKMSKLFISDIPKHNFAINALCVLAVLGYGVNRKCPRHCRSEECVSPSPSS